MISNVVPVTSSRAVAVSIATARNVGRTCAWCAARLETLMITTASIALTKATRRIDRDAI